MKRAVAVAWLLVLRPGVLLLTSCASAPVAPAATQRGTAASHLDLGPDPFRELDAGPPPLAPATAAVEPAPAPDPRIEEEAALRALARGPDCAAMRAGLAAHAEVSPAAVKDVLAAEARCEERARNVTAARGTAQALLLACGPDAIARCRTRTLGLQRRLAAAAPRSPSMTAHVKAVGEADACLVKAERAASHGAPLPPCLGTAEALYRADADALMRQRALFLHARAALPRDPAAADRLLSQAASACGAPRCAVEKIRVLDAQAALALKQGHLDQVLLTRLQQDRVAVEALPPARRDYARSAKVEAACAALDAAQGAGACRALEKKSEGHWTFHDPLAHVFAGDLPREEALRTNDDFQVTLQECFRDEAGRLPVPSQVRFHLRWTINQEGRVEQVHLDVPADDQGPLASCLRERFKIWRYPRSGGELQHVEQSFTVTARPR
jgi:hypothetical protein